MNNTYMNTIDVPDGAYVFFCSQGHRTILEGELPHQDYLWAQLYLPNREPTPKDSWFCKSDPISMKSNTFYVYKLIRPIKMFIDYGYDPQRFTSNLENVNKTLKNKISSAKQSNDYKEMAIMQKIFNIDGVFRGYDNSEVIIFGPFDDKMEFYKMYGGENAKTTWKNNGRYFNPSNNVIKQVKKALPSLSYYSKIHNYVKE